MRKFIPILSLSLLLPWVVAAKTYHALRGESSLTYVLVHPMHVIHGTDTNFTCDVDLPGDPPQDFSAVHVKVSAKVADFNSGNSSRDSHMLEVVEGLKYPLVDFVSSAIAKVDSGYKVTGKLRFHGQEREESFVLREKDEGLKVVMTGGMNVLLSDFGVPRPSLLLVPVKNEMRIEIKAVANRNQP